MMTRFDPMFLLRADAARRPVPARGASQRRRRGVTAILAMLYLTLFSVLALGFYASISTSTRLAANDRSAANARLSAESGMQFVKFHLSNLNLPGSTPSAELLSATKQILENRLEDDQSATYPAGVDMVAWSSAAQDLIVIPAPTAAGPSYVSLGEGGGRFRVELWRHKDKQIRAKVIGRYADGADGATVAAAARGIQLDYGLAEKAGSIFEFGVASRSRIHLNSNARIEGAGDWRLGSVLSTAVGAYGNSVLTLDGNAIITGEVTFSDPSARLHGLSMSSNAKIGNPADPGTANSSKLQEYLNYDVPAPDFPDINTDVWKQFAGNPAYGGTVISPVPGDRPKFDSGTPLRNLYIRANANPIFDSNQKIYGVIYIEEPNRVTFNSNVEIHGPIVTANKVDDPVGSPRPYVKSDEKATGQHLIEFHSNVKLIPVESLTTNPVTKNDPHFPKALTDLTGATVLAPGFKIHLNSNFGSTGGSIIGDWLEFDSNATGTIKGSVLNLADRADTKVHMDSNARITIQSLGTSNIPAGVTFGSRYDPIEDTYQEVQP